MNNTKFGHILNVAYALAITFAIVGTVIRPGELPLTILLTVVLTWVTVQIIQTGARSLFELLDKNKSE